MIDSHINHTAGLFIPPTYHQRNRLLGPWWLIKRDSNTEGPGLYREGAPLFHTVQVSQLFVRAGGRAEVDWKSWVELRAALLGMGPKAI